MLATISYGRARAASRARWRRAVAQALVTTALVGQGVSHAQGPTPSAMSAGSLVTAREITTLAVQSKDQVAQSQVPLTFGQVFARGDLPRDAKLVATVAGERVPVQLDVKARHDDGSVRHGVVSAAIPQLDAGGTAKMVLSTSPSGEQTVASLPTQRDLMRAGFSAKVRLQIEGRSYRASPNSMLWQQQGVPWLTGPIAPEWIVDAPLVDDAGAIHPHLAARFVVRWYPEQSRARVDVVLENMWAYEPHPQNYLYDVNVRVGEKLVYEKQGLEHFARARWRKSFWWGAEPKVHLRHDIRYLVASGAVPHYDLTFKPAASALDSLAAAWKAAPTEPMAPGLVLPAMPTTGGRDDIAPLPKWAALYLLSMDARAKAATLGTSDLAGSWPMHYRDKNTGRPVSLADYPYMTILGRPGDTVNPRTGLSEAFPECNACDTEPYVYQVDSAHQPSLAYLPYLVTGDHYHLEELQFWANYNMLQSNPHYRGFEMGLLKWDQVRGQAWSLRTLGHAAYITPDDDPMKSYFTERLRHNLDWYRTTYVDGRSNALGVIDAGYAIVYTTPAGPSTGVAPWMDDFFTWSVGHLATGLGFDDALSLARWKGTFPVGRMTAPGYCWIDGAVYALAVRPATGSPMFSDLRQAYLTTMQGVDSSGRPVPLVNSTGALYLDQPCGSLAQAQWRTQLDIDMNVHRSPWVAGEMTGYASAASGFPSNMQPALAAAVDVGVPNARTAWDVFMNRSVKPDYTQAPQWAVVPTGQNRRSPRR
jgi:hypothetical protein